MASALDKLVSGSDNKDGPDSFDYVVVLSRSSASMKVTYLMIDHDTHSLAPKIMMVKWPRFMDLIDYRACVVKNVLYVTGGREKSTGKYLKQVLKYDPAEGRWRECANMRKCRAGHTATTLNGRIFVTGGASSDKEFQDSVESYEPMTDEWHREEAMFSARRHHAAVVKDSVLYVTGGMGKTDTGMDNMWQFEKYWPDPSNPAEYEYTWKKSPLGGGNKVDSHGKMLYSLYSHTSLFHGSTLLVLGGVCYGLSYDGSTFISADEASSEQPEKEPQKTVATSDIVTAYRFPKKLTKAEQQTIKAAEELAKQVKKGEAHVHAPNCPQSQEFKAKKRWIRNIPDLPSPRCGAGAITVGHKVYVIGGHKMEDAESASNNLVQFYHSKKDTWYTAFDLGEGDHREVELVQLNVPRSNKDFRPMRYSNCKWVMW